MKSFESDLRIVRPDGEVRFVHHSVAVDSSRNAVGVRVHGTVQDVTEARAAEQKLREQANLLNLSHDAIVVREADDTIRFGTMAQSASTDGPPKRCSAGARPTSVMSTARSSCARKKCWPNAASGLASWSTSARMAAS